MGNAFSLMKHGFIRINFFYLPILPGAVFEKSWFYGSWNEEWLSYNITVKELYPIVLAVGLWCERLANRSVCFQCDNEEWLSYNITVKELYAIVLAVGLWCERLANRSVCFQCDNEALALILNKKSSIEKNVMYFLRKLVFLSLRFNILFKAEHIPEKRNVLSDALSSLQVNRFQRLLPDAEVEPTLIPAISVLPC